MPTNTTPSTGSSQITPTGCCPPFDPSTWDRREVIWRGRPFVKEHIHSLFHIPLDMTSKMAKATAKIAAAGAATEQGLTLSDELSPWSSDLYIDVTHPVPGAEMASLSGDFLTRVYDGPFRDAPRWIDDMKQYAADKNREIQKIYLGYTTCPKCAKAYGHNYVVVFAKVAEQSS